jgi:hypothetical protein
MGAIGGGGHLERSAAFSLQNHDLAGRRQERIRLTQEGFCTVNGALLTAMFNRTSN